MNAYHALFEQLEPLNLMRVLRAAPHEIPDEMPPLPGEALGLLRHTADLDLFHRVADGDPVSRGARAAWYYSYAREVLLPYYGFSVPTEEALDAVAAHSPHGVTEIGAGGAYWAHLLAARGVDVQASDHLPDDRNEYTRKFWHPVAERDAVDAARDAGDRTLLMGWPVPDSEVMNRALAAYSGPRVAYVGEWGASCGTPGLFRQLDTAWRTVGHVRLPQWACIRDGLWLLERR